MNELLEPFASPIHWIFIVVLSVILNLASAYFKRGIDRTIARVSRKYACRNEKLAQQRVKRIESLRSNKHQHILATLFGLAHILSGVWMIGLGAFLLLYAALLPRIWLWRLVMKFCFLASSAIFFLFGLRTLLRGNIDLLEAYDALRDSTFKKEASTDQSAVN